MTQGRKERLLRWEGGGYRNHMWQELGITCGSSGSTGSGPGGVGADSSFNVSNHSAAFAARLVWQGNALVHISMHGQLGNVIRETCPDGDPLDRKDWL
jgi:hypothetical protein